MIVSTRKVRTLIAFILVLVLTASAGTVYAAPEEPVKWTREGDLLYAIKTYEGSWVPGGSATGAVVKFDGDTHDFVVPETLGGYSVIGVAKWANNTHEPIESLILPDSVICIEDGSLPPTPAFTTLTLPANLRRIERLAMCDTKNLESLVVPDSVCEIGEYAFARAKSLRFLHLPAALTEIPERMCERSESLQTVEFPAGLKSIGVCAFVDNTALKEISFPDSIELIAECAFSGCDNLVVNSLPRSLRTVEIGAFRGATAADLYVPDGVEEIGNYALPESSTVSLPASLKKLGSSNTGSEKTQFRGTMDQWIALVGQYGYRSITVECTDGKVFNGKKYPLSEESDEPAETARPTESTPEPAQTARPTESTPEPAQTARPTESTPEPAPASKPTSSTAVFTPSPYPTQSAAPTTSARPSTSVFPSSSPSKTASVKPTQSSSSTRPAGSWNPATDTSWFSISDLMPESGEEVIVVISCGAQALKYKLIAQPLDAGAAAERLDNEPSDGVLLFPVAGDDQQSEYTHRIRVSGSAGSRILLRAEGTYGDTRDEYPFKAVLGTLVIREGNTSISPAAGSAVTVEESDNGDKLILGTVVGSSKDFTSAGELQQMIDAGGLRTRVVDRNGNVVPDGDPVGTGMYLETLDKDNHVLGRVVIIVKGDVTGTGIISLTQVVRLAKAFTGMRLDYPYDQAADWNGNGRVDLSDLVNEAKVFAVGQPAVHPAGSATVAPRPSAAASPATAATARPTATATARPTAAATARPTADARPTPTSTVTPSSTAPTVSSAVKSKNRERHEYAVWSMPVYSYLYPKPDGGYTRVEVIYPKDERIIIEDYDKDFRITGIKELYFTDELPIWGGMLVGKDHNFIVYGAGNQYDDNNTEVIRVVKYDKNWDRLDSVSIRGANTWSPFTWGSLRCTEHNGYLYVRTCHRMYAEPPDYYHHQANWTFNVRESDMNVTDDYHYIANPSVGYISHSNNQFILVDKEGRLVALDHADAYPRGPVITRYVDPAGQDKFISDSWNAVKYTSLTEFAGTDGLQSTGASIGGFEETTSGYVTAYNYDGIGGTPSRQRRDIYLAYIDKDLNSPKVQQLTTSGWNFTPQTVATGLDGGYILWMSGHNAEDYGDELHYARYDSSGKVGPVRTVKDAVLSDCKPIYNNGKVVWYTTDDSAPVFYELDETGIKATPAG